MSCAAFFQKHKADDDMCEKTSKNSLRSMYAGVCVDIDLKTDEFCDAL